MCVAWIGLEWIGSDFVKGRVKLELKLKVNDRTRGFNI